LKIRFLQRAAREYAGAIEYYENQQVGLGAAFAQDVDLTLSKIVAYPSAWQLVSKDVRRCLLRRFPYGVMYAIEPDAILVLSVFDLRRDPENLPI
jgi:hypothetical protein